MMVVVSMSSNIVGGAKAQINIFNGLDGCVDSGMSEFKRGSKHMDDTKA